MRLVLEWETKEAEGCYAEAGNGKHLFLSLALKILQGHCKPIVSWQHFPPPSMAGKDTGRNHKQGYLEVLFILFVGASRKSAVGKCTTCWRMSITTKTIQKVEGQQVGGIPFCLMGHFECNAKSSWISTKKCYIKRSCPCSFSVCSPTD